MKCHKFELKLNMLFQIFERQICLKIILVLAFKTRLQVGWIGFWNNILN